MVGLQESSTGPFEVSAHGLKRTPVTNIMRFSLALLSHVDTDAQ